MAQKQIAWVVIILVVVVSITLSQRTPTISYISPNIVTQIGGSVEMDCSVLFAAAYPVLWMKLPSNCKSNSHRDVLSGDFRTEISDKCTPTPLSSESALIIRDHRFSMRYDTASATYTLQIKDVQRSDEAIYQCQILIGINNKITKHVALQVRKPPVITDNSTRSVVVVENSPAELMCYAVGSPKPVVSWRRENNAILPTGGIIYRGNVLKIHSIKREDRGTYYCVADNHVGKPDKKSVAVDVEFKPQVSVTEGRIGQAFGYSVEMICNVEAFPRPTITWIHKGIQLSTNRDYVVDGGFQSTDDFTETSVRIRKLNRRQLGSYFCRAQNKLGDTEQEIVVEETYQPNCAVGLCDAFAASSGSSDNGTNHIWTVGLVVAFSRIVTTAESF